MCYLLLDTYADAYGFPSRPVRPEALEVPGKLPQKLEDLCDAVRSFNSTVLPGQLSMLSQNVRAEEDSQAVAACSTDSPKWANWAHFAMHRRRSTFHKLMENLHLMAFSLDAFSPVSTFVCCWNCYLINPHVRVSSSIRPRQKTCSKALPSAYYKRM
jgi:hypothetical protein